MQWSTVASGWTVRGASFEHHFARVIALRENPYQGFAVEHNERANAVCRQLLDGVEDSLLWSNGHNCPALMVEQGTNMVAQFHNTSASFLSTRILPPNSSEFGAGAGNPGKW
jgi:hypothetical protein